MATIISTPNSAQFPMSGTLNPVMQAPSADTIEKWDDVSSWLCQLRKAVLTKIRKGKKQNTYGSYLFLSE